MRGWLPSFWECFQPPGEPQCQPTTSPGLCPFPGVRWGWGSHIQWLMRWGCTGQAYRPIEDNSKGHLTSRAPCGVGVGGGCLGACLQLSFPTQPCFPLGSHRSFWVASSVRWRALFSVPLRCWALHTVSQWKAQADVGLVPLLLPSSEWRHSCTVRAVSK